MGAAAGALPSFEPSPLPWCPVSDLPAADTQATERPATLRHRPGCPSALCAFQAPSAISTPRSRVVVRMIRPRFAFTCRGLPHKQPARAGPPTHRLPPMASQAVNKLLRVIGATLATSDAPAAGGDAGGAGPRLARRRARQVAAGRRLHAGAYTAGPCQGGRCLALLFANCRRPRLHPMINWFYKFRVPGLGEKTSPPAKAVPAAPTAAKPAGVNLNPSPPPRPAKDIEADWAPRLQAAIGDDAALLELLGATPVLAVKLSAVQALTGEAALKAAERATRQHDRRVHRLAKQRHDAAVAQRQNRARAQMLLDAAQARVGDHGVAVNQLVELDRDWQALDAGLIEPAQAAAFSSLREQLATQVRDHGEQLQAAQRWNAEAARCRDTLSSALTQTAAVGVADDLLAPMRAVQSVLASRPQVPATQAAAAALQTLLDTAEAVQVRLAWLGQAAAQAATDRGDAGDTGDLGDAGDAGDAGATGDAGVTGATGVSGDTRNGGNTDGAHDVGGAGDADDTPPPDAARAPAAWTDLPAVADHALAQALARRFEARQRAAAARPAVAAPPAATKPSRVAKPVPPSGEQQATLDALLQQAEEALAEGRTSTLQQRLQAIEQWLDDAGPLRLADGWHQRWSSVQTEGARLKGWQAWGGARARDALVAEAEALARIATAAMASAEPMAPAPAAPAGAGDDSAGALAAAAARDAEDADGGGSAAGIDGQAALDLGVRAAGDLGEEAAAAIEGETAGDPGARAAAGTTGHVGNGADHAASVGAARQAVVQAAAAPVRPPRLKLKAHADAIHDLRQRWKQLDHQGAAAKQSTWARFDAALQTAYLPVAAQQAAQQAARERNLQVREALLLELESTALPGDGAGVAAWRDMVRALDRFQLAWRPLGPLEHTVPGAARAPLQQRLRAAVDRIEVPLAAARDAAAARRERLITDAQALVDGSGRPPGPQATARVRELQAAWQDEARTLPLTRNAENALWSRFKAATDAVYALRDAGFAARDAEAAAALAEREKLLAGLSALPADTAPAEVEKRLSEIDRAWRQGAELSRGAAAQLDARYAEARAAVRRQAAEQGRRRWHAECDALAARLALCAEREDRLAAGSDVDGLASRWVAAVELPSRWQQALQERWAGPAAAGPLPAAEVDLHLLQLEAVFDLPASAEQQAARRELKLRALKDALEGRTRANDGAAEHLAWWLALLRQAGTRPSQRDRLARLLAALRESQPGSLAGPPPRA
jgi:Domain of Unknown Function (DUF349)